VSSASRSSSPNGRGGPRFWAACALVFALLVYAGVRLIPPTPPPRLPLAAVDIPAVVVPIEFVLEGKLNLNRASTEELQKLPGVGPVLAARIVAFREEHGPFRTVDDLLQVSGIGPKTLAGFWDLVTTDEDGP